MGAGVNMISMTELYALLLASALLLPLLGMATAFFFEYLRDPHHQMEGMDSRRATGAFSTLTEAPATGSRVRGAGTDSSPIVAKSLPRQSKI